MDRLGFKLLGGLARIFGALASKDEDPYWFGIQSTNGAGFVNLAAAVGAQGAAVINVSQEADFVATRVLAISVVTATGVIMPPQTVIGPSYSLVITDGGSDRQLMNVPIHNEVVEGTGQRSTPLTKNRLFRRNSSINFALVNLQAIATQTWIALMGYKIYDEKSLDLVARR